MEALSRRLAAIVAILVLGAGSPSAGVPQAPTEYEVKAAYLCNFAQFVEWPEGKEDPLTIGILGDDPFGPQLTAIAKERSLPEMPLVTRRVSSLEEARKCRILFVSESEKPGLPRILAGLSGTSVLTVSDIPGFAARGGMIEFVLEHKRVRFEINVEVAESAKLRISSRLLKLARIVPSSRSGGGP